MHDDATSSVEADDVAPRSARNISHAPDQNPLHLQHGNDKSHVFRAQHSELGNDDEDCELQAETSLVDVSPIRGA